MVFISSEEYKELLEYKFKYELEHEKEVEEEPRKFKIGDRVKIINTNDLIGTITRISIDGNYVEFNDPMYINCEYDDKELELVEEREEIK